MWYVYIDRHVITENAKNGTRNPPIRIQDGLYGESKYAIRVRFPAETEIVYKSDGDSFIPFVYHTKDGPQTLPGDTGTRLVIACPEEPVILE